MNNKLCTIYVLYEPYTNKVRYVGQTTKKLRKRLRGHILDANRENKSYLHRWINKCIKNNGFVGCVSIQESATWNEDEIKWIKQFRDEGYDLVNSTLGGDGNCGFVPTIETRKKISESKRGHKMPNNVREALLKSHLGIKMKEEHKKNISKATTGKSKKLTDSRIKRFRKIICIETGEIFQSLTEAAKIKHVQLKHLPAVCSGKRKSTGGFTWRYA